MIVVIGCVVGEGVGVAGIEHNTIVGVVIGCVVGEGVGVAT